MINKLLLRIYGVEKKFERAALPQIATKYQHKICELHNFRRWIGLLSVILKTLAALKRTRCGFGKNDTEFLYQKEKKVTTGIMIMTI